jgi:hypothetical protein
MKKNISNIIATLVKYGFTLGLIKIVVSYLFFLINPALNDLRIITHLQVALSIFISFLIGLVAVWNYNKNKDHKALNVKDGLILGLGFSILSGILKLIYAFLVINFFNLEFLENPMIRNDYHKHNLGPILFTISFVANPLIVSFWSFTLKKRFI